MDDAFPVALRVPSNASIHRQCGLSVHQILRVVCHDGNLPFYSNSSGVGVSGPIGTGSSRQEICAESVPKCVNVSVERPLTSHCHSLMQSCCSHWQRPLLAGSRRCRHQVACRIPDIQPRQGTPWLFKLDDDLDRQVVAGTTL